MREPQTSLATFRTLQACGLIKKIRSMKTKVRKKSNQFSLILMLVQINKTE